MPSASVPVPLGGWNTFDGIVGLDPGFAPVLDNFLPEMGRIRMRAGYRSWASGLPGRVDGLLSYQSPPASFLFAASGAGIYDVTSPGVAGAPVVSGLTSARWDGINVAAASGNFLLAFNGADTARTFNGTTWAAWAPTVVPLNIGWATTFKGYIFAGRSDQLTFWYSIPGAIAGAFTAFPLQGVARRGGGIAGAVDWTLDSGTGPDDYAAFVTTEGECIVYRGTNPSAPSTWSLVGVFSMPRPIGRRFLRQFGGDILVLTEGGIHALSSVVRGTDQAALASKAYTVRIEPSFLDLSRGRGDQLGWDIVSLTSYGIWLVNVPWGISAQQIAFRAASGACARWVGLPAACWLQWGNRAFFGHASSGNVMLWGEDESDAGGVISAECVCAFSAFGEPALLKRFTLLQRVLSDAAGAAVRAEMCIDWRIPASSVEAGVPAPGVPPTAVNPLFLTWDAGNWDAKNWAGAGEISRVWQGVSGLGLAGAVRLRLDSSTGRPGWLASQVVWENGGPLR